MYYDYMQQLVGKPKIEDILIVMVKYFDVMW
jgi:hypothetical protein